VFKSEDIVFIDNSPGTDFAILAGCDHMIMSIGTFGWWIAWLGAHQRGGDVLYFANYFNFDNDSIQQEVELRRSTIHLLGFQLEIPKNWAPLIRHATLNSRDPHPQPDRGGLASSSGEGLILLRLLQVATEERGLVGVDELLTFLHASLKA
jgi:hypothetical protein